MMSPPSDEKPVITSVITSEFSQEERRLLLRLAHRAISAALGVQKLDLTPPTPHLAQPQGAFSTLHLQGKLRGCIGYVLPKHSLFQTVAEAARAAAFDDPRFAPVTAEEAPLLADRNQRSVALTADSAGRGRCGSPRAGRQQRQPPRVVAPTGSRRVGLGPRDFPVPDLPEGWLGARLLDA